MTSHSNKISYIPTINFQRNTVEVWKKHPCTHSLKTTCTSHISISGIVSRMRKSSLLKDIMHANRQVLCRNVEGVHNLRYPKFQTQARKFANLYTCVRFIYVNVYWSPTAWISGLASYFVRRRIFHHATHKKTANKTTIHISSSTWNTTKEICCGFTSCRQNHACYLPI